MSKFEAGRTYYTRSICDADQVVRVTVAKRTAKTITTAEGKTLRIREWQGVESVKPWGSYSMAPIVSADRVEALPEPEPAADYWREDMPENVARAYLGDVFDFAVSRGAGYCAGRAAGAWDANDVDTFAAYKAAERAAARLADPAPVSAVVIDFQAARAARVALRA